MKVEATPCPSCKVVGELQIDVKMVALPIGSFSLAGAQTKLSAQLRPVLSCNLCDFECVGDFTHDGHVFFRP